MSSGAGSTAAFEGMFRVYSVAMAGKATLETGDKLLLPSSALSVLTRMAVQYPMHFRVTNVANSKVTHCGVMEFTAEEGRCYMPHWIMQNLSLGEGAFINVRNVVLPKARFVVFQPQLSTFNDISNPKAVLEMELRKHTALTNGDTLVIKYLGTNHALKVLDLKPADACSIIETDCEVDFAAPADYKPPVKAAPAPAPAADALKIAAPPDTASAAGTPNPAAAAAAARRAGYTPFAGAGQKVGALTGVGESKSTPRASPLPSSAGGVIVSSGERPTSAKPRTLNKFEAARAAKAFTGEGKSIRE